jgi:hypothetical protein
MARVSFPDGIPSPYITLRTNGHGLPFARANVHIYSEDEEEIQEFKKSMGFGCSDFCSKPSKLGVHSASPVCFLFKISTLTLLVALPASFFRIDRYPTKFNTSFVYREHLLNSTEFIILGQRALLYHGMFRTNVLGAASY